jgi:hypothetical protein
MIPEEYRELCHQAIIDEIQTLVTLEVVEWAPISQGRQPIPYRMVEKVKFKGDGSFDKIKMRCVVRGFLQRNEADCGATYSPTATMSSLRILLTAAVTNGWDIFELDVKNPYCHGIMDKNIHIFPR